MRNQDRHSQQGAFSTPEQVFRLARKSNERRAKNALLYHFFLFSPIFGTLGRAKAPEDDTIAEEASPMYNQYHLHLTIVLNDFSPLSLCA